MCNHGWVAEMELVFKGHYEHGFVSAFLCQMASVDCHLLPILDKSRGYLAAVRRTHAGYGCNHSSSLGHVSQESPSSAIYNPSCASPKAVQALEVPWGPPRWQSWAPHTTTTTSLSEPAECRRILDMAWYRVSALCSLPFFVSGGREMINMITCLDTSCNNNKRRTNAFSNGLCSR